MGSKYEFGINPFQDLLIQMLMDNMDISNKRLKKDVNTTFSFILESALSDQIDIKHLDFEIINNNGSYVVKGKNSVSAIWLSGVIVDDVDFVLKSSIFAIGDRKYKYNKKTNELIFIGNV